MICKKETP